MSVNQVMRTGTMAIMLLVFFATGCKKEMINPPVVQFENPQDSIQTIGVATDLLLSPKIAGSADRYSWLEDGKEVSTTATYTFKKDTPGDYTITCVVSNAGGNSTITYKIKVKGKYSDGVLLLNYADDAGNGAEISYIDETGNLIKDVFSKENDGLKLSSSANCMYHFDGNYYITSSRGPDYISVLQDHSLRLNYTITQSGVSAITYFATADGKTGYVNITNRRKPGLYAVDLAAKNISGTAVAGSETAVLLPLQHIGQKLLVPAGKQLIGLDNGILSVLKSYSENVCGAAAIGQNIWVAVSGNGTAKFVKYDMKMTPLDSVQLGATFKLPANGIMTASCRDEYIYWQETSRGVTCRFNTSTKTAEDFVNHWESGISFATCWKVHPRTGDVYIADSPGIFSGENYSDLYIFSKEGGLKKKIEKAGYQITDIVFP